MTPKVRLIIKLLTAISATASALTAGVKYIELRFEYQISGKVAISSDMPAFFSGIFDQISKEASKTCEGGIDGWARSILGRQCLRANLHPASFRQLGVCRPRSETLEVKSHEVSPALTRIHEIAGGDDCFSLQQHDGAMTIRPNAGATEVRFRNTEGDQIFWFCGCTEGVRIEAVRRAGGPTAP